jgi:hypothetical protein
VSEKKVIYISQSALAHSGCIEKFYKIVVEGYKEPAMPAAVVYGIAGAKYLDTMFKTNGNGPLAMKAAREAFSLPKVNNDKQPWLSDERHLMATCGNLWCVFVENESTFEILEFNGKPATEFTFDIKLYEFENFIIRLAGTIDKLGQFKRGCFAIGDWKFTSAWDIKSYLSNYEMSKQLRLYTLACKLEARTNPDSVLGRIGATKMGAFIDAIKIHQDPNKVEMTRSEVFQYSNEDIDEFHSTLSTWIATRLMPALESGKRYKEGIFTGTCLGQYGYKCTFWSVCKSNPTIAELLLKRDFIKKPFDPLHYND